MIFLLISIVGAFLNAAQIKHYSRYLENLLASLNERTSAEKSQKVEEFFWLLEEYKISIFAQEIKTRTKVSAKKLDRFLTDLSTMI